MIPSNDMAYLNMRVTSFDNMKSALEAKSLIDNLCKLNNMQIRCRYIHSIKESHQNGMHDLNSSNPLLS